MTVRKNKHDNTWIVDISAGNNAVTGKRQRYIKRNIKTRREALELEPLLRIQHFGDTSAVKGITMALLHTLTVEADKCNQCKDSHLRMQESYYNKHFKGYFKDAKMDLIGYKDIEVFRETLIAKKLANSTINRLMGQLSKLFKTAIKQNFRQDNPCKALRNLPVHKNKMTYWTVDEFKRFLALFDTSIPEEYAFQLFFKVAFSTGMRKGELLALTWEDIDFNTQTITVSHTLVRQPKGVMKRTSPKTKAGNRKITIHQGLIDELKAWQEVQKKDLSSLCSDTKTLQLFQFVPDMIVDFKVDRFYKKVMKRTDSLHAIRIHDFRHSHVALLINQEETPYVIMERLGHASITTTYNTYGHLYPSKQKSLSDKLNNLF